MRPAAAAAHVDQTGLGKRVEMPSNRALVETGHVGQPVPTEHTTT
jgi:hypothetical protein